MAPFYTTGAWLANGGFGDYSTMEFPRSMLAQFIRAQIAKYHDTANSPVAATRNGMSPAVARISSHMKKSEPDTLAEITTNTTAPARPRIVQEINATRENVKAMQASEIQR